MTLDRVVVVGTGLIGTSVALALRDHQVRVYLADRDTDALHGAIRLGAGVAWSEQLVAEQQGVPEEPADLAVLAVPPSQVAPVLLAAQQVRTARFYTDVASVKAPIIAQARQLGCDLSNFVPGHPIAGGHQNGPHAARGDLFKDRTWVLCPSAADQTAVSTARHAVELVGATVRVLDAEEHDRAVAVSSHVPHVVSSVLAASFAHAEDMTLQLTGRGVLDTTRIAEGDPDLWVDILRHNADAVADALTAISADLHSVITSLRATAVVHLNQPHNLRSVLEQGNHGRKRLLVRHPCDHRHSALAGASGPTCHPPVEQLEADTLCDEFALQPRHQASYPRECVAAPRTHL
jgi:prephenate dehydrogenase